MKIESSICSRKAPPALTYKDIRNCPGIYRPLAYPESRLIVLDENFGLWIPVFPQRGDIAPVNWEAWASDFFEKIKNETLTLKFS